mgnify:CR=1 FL=1
MTKSKTEVTVAQKIFEKFIMASCCDPSELGVMVAKNGKGRVETFLCLNGTPLALLLTKSEIDKWTPLFKLSEKVDDLFQKERRKVLEEREGWDWVAPDSFGDGTVNPVFDFDSPVLKNLEETAQKLK